VARLRLRKEIFQDDDQLLQVVTYLTNAVQRICTYVPLDIVGSDICNLMA